MLKNKKYDEFITQKLNELYNSNYEIISRCSVSHEGGINYEIVMIKLKNFDYPIISKFDWEENGYQDNYDELKQADELNYSLYINSIFNDTIISMMYFSNDEDYNGINLSMLLSKDYLSDENILKNKIKQITIKSAEQFPNYSFNFRIYFLEKIDDKLIEKYYQFMSNSGRCNSDFTKGVSSSVIRTINIYIDEDTDIDAKIDDSFYR